MPDFTWADHCRGWWIERGLRMSLGRGTPGLSSRSVAGIGRHDTLRFAPVRFARISHAMQPTQTFGDTKSKIPVLVAVSDIPSGVDSWARRLRRAFEGHPHYRLLRLACNADSKYSPGFDLYARSRGDELDVQLYEESERLFQPQLASLGMGLNVRRASLRARKLVQRRMAPIGRRNASASSSRDPWGASRG